MEGQTENASLPSFLERVETLFGDEVLIQTSPVCELPDEVGFQILPSDHGFSDVGDLPADVATCGDCRKELLDPNDRRFRYPFITCASCGPRFSISLAMPYDRQRTTMIDFPRCEVCETEYLHTRDRRFHAETISCAQCGPTLELCNQQGEPVAAGNDALIAAANFLRDGLILAVKGVGGFHLITDAMRDASVVELRRRKARPDKPFALLFPHLTSLREHCHVSPFEEELLRSSAAPIVLLNRVSESGLSRHLAPGLNSVGAALPSHPLQHLLAGDFGGPLIATSGNRSDEPLCYDEGEAVHRLKGIADHFLWHNRRIHRPVDDSVVRVIEEKITVLRRARGYPLRVGMVKSQRRWLGAGSFLKNTVAWTEKEGLYLSPHLGDLVHPKAQQRFCSTLNEISAESQNNYVADLHPDYASTRAVEVLSVKATEPLLRLQHHKAHVLSGIVDCGLAPPLLGVAWDGAGLGDDGSIWGGEFFDVRSRQLKRVASFSPFLLLGGERAIRDPRRVALALLWESNLPIPTHGFGFTVEDLNALRHLFDHRLNSPLCSSVGRLFDGVAALTSVAWNNTYEGHAASLLEARGNEWRADAPAYPFEFDGFHLDWRPMICEIMARPEPRPHSEIAARFHQTLADMILTVANRVQRREVLLSGGCFQNELLSRMAIRGLRGNGFSPFWHHQIPPNDGGLSVGQVKAAIEGLCV